MYKRTNSNPSQPTHTLEKSIGNQFLFTGCTVYFWSTLWDTPVCQGTRGDGQKDEGKGLLFLCASEYFYTQSDPAVPRPGKDPNEPSVDRRVYHVLSVRVVVKVPLEYLEKWQHEWLLMVLRRVKSFCCLVGYLTRLFPQKQITMERIEMQYSCPIF